MGQKAEWWLPGVGGEGEMGGYCLTSTKFPMEKMKTFWKWMMTIVALQRECNAMEL